MSSAAVLSDIELRIYAYRLALLAEVVVELGDEVARLIADTPAQDARERRQCLERRLRELRAIWPRAEAPKLEPLEGKH